MEELKEDARGRGERMRQEEDTTLDKVIAPELPGRSTYKAHTRGLAKSESDALSLNVDLKKPRNEACGKYT